MASGLGFSTPRSPLRPETLFQMVCLSFSICYNPKLICDIEPGYYEDGKFGIRIESELYRLWLQLEKY